MNQFYTINQMYNHSIAVESIFIAEQIRQKKRK
jgi:hypothetical protein